MEKHIEQELRNHIESMNQEQKDKYFLLECVSRKPRLEYLELYVSMGFNPLYVTRTKMNLLHIIAAKKCTDILEFLIQHGADVNGRNNDQETPLHIAASSGDAESIQILIDAGSDINAIDDQGRTPLIRAAHSNRMLFACKALLDRNADMKVSGLERGRLVGHSIIALDDPRLINEITMKMGLFSLPDDEGEYPIHLAVQLGKFKAVKAFVKLGIDINMKSDKKGFTPMHHAVRSGQVEILHFLYEHGASEEIPNADNETARELAEKMQWPKVIAALESAREEAEIRQIQQSVIKGNTMKTSGQSGNSTRKSKAKKNVNSHIQPEVMNDIIIFEHVLNMLEHDMVKMSSLRSHLRKMNAYDMSGEGKRTLLHHAAIHGCPDLIKYLLGKKADPTMKDELNRTPLMYAILSGNEQSVKLLINQEYDIHETDQFNNSLFVLAYWMEMHELAMRLVSEGSDNRGLIDEHGRPTA